MFAEIEIFETTLRTNNPLYKQISSTRFFSVLSKLKSTKTAFKLNSNVNKSNSFSNSKIEKIKLLSKAQRGLFKQSH